MRAAEGAPRNQPQFFKELRDGIAVRRAVLSLQKRLQSLLKRQRPVLRGKFPDFVCPASTEAGPFSSFLKVSAVFLHAAVQEGSLGFLGGQLTFFFNTAIRRCGEGFSRQVLRQMFDADVS